MDKYKRYYGVISFCIAIAVIIVVGVLLIQPKIAETKSLESTIAEKQAKAEDLQHKLNIVQAKIKKIKILLHLLKRKLIHL